MVPCFEFQVIHELQTEHGTEVALACNRAAFDRCDVMRAVRILIFILPYVAGYEDGSKEGTTARPACCPPKPRSDISLEFSFKQTTLCIYLVQLA